MPYVYVTLRAATTNYLFRLFTFASAFPFHQPAKMALFNSLPNALRLAILEELYRTGSDEDLTATLRVSKQLNDLESPILWTYLSIHNKNIFQFLRSSSAVRVQTFKLIHNLSVLVHPIISNTQPFNVPLSRFGFPSDVFTFLEDSVWHKENEKELQVPGYMVPLSRSGLPHQLCEESLAHICLVAAAAQLVSIISKDLKGLTTFSSRLAHQPMEPYDKV